MFETYQRLNLSRTGLLLRTDMRHVQDLAEE
jgi:hypothetical protein